MPNPRTLAIVIPLWHPEAAHEWSAVCRLGQKASCGNMRNESGALLPLRGQVAKFSEYDSDGRRSDSDEPVTPCRKWRSSEKTEPRELQLDGSMGCSLLQARPGDRGSRILQSGSYPMQRELLDIGGHPQLLRPESVQEQQQLQPGVSVTARQAAVKHCAATTVP